MIVIAIGANLPQADGTPALQTCHEAVAALARLPGLKLAGSSAWYWTAPMPPSGQPPYINGVALLAGEADPAALLQRLHDIEAANGRVRSEPNAARTLDLDLIAMDGLVRTTPDPVLPHPRAHQRAFVLRPLLDVAPDWRHPVSGLPATALLARLGEQGVRPILPEAASHLRDEGAAPIYDH